MGTQSADNSSNLIVQTCPNLVYLETSADSDSLACKHRGQTILNLCFFFSSSF